MGHIGSILPDRLYVGRIIELRQMPLTSARIILLHYAEVKIPIELGAEVNIRCRSPQVGAEVIPCRSYSCRTSIAPSEREALSERAYFGQNREGHP